MKDKGEIIVYQSDTTLQLEVRMEDETVWLTQAQMAELFESSKQNISLHINNVFKEGELQKDSVVKDYLTTASDGKNYRYKLYNLDVIISVGYRVKSQRGTQFRIWANKVLKDYMLKGYVMDKRMDRIEQTLSEFQSSKANISEHIKNIYESSELSADSTVRNFRTVRLEGGRTIPS